MTNKNLPTIKGIFVNSHIRAVKKTKGEAGIRKFQRMFGKSVNFRNTQDVPVRDEVKILECAIKILYGDKISKKDVAFEAGKLHFRDFATTPLAKIIFAVFKNNFKVMMIQTEHIAGHVFQRVQFQTQDLGENAVRVVMKNNDYPLDHFRGLFQEWMDYMGCRGKVVAKNSSKNTYKYTMRWRKG